MKTRTWCGALLLAATAQAAAMPPAPPTYIDPGACPFECCVYREWTTRTTTGLRAGPERRARVVGAAFAGDTVKALTGQVVTTRPGRFRVLRDFVGGSGQHYAAGEAVPVYTTLGEGYVRLWHDGAMRDEEALFMFDDPAGANACPAGEAACWGRREARAESTWWVQVRTPAGVTGWSDQPGHFGHMDACGSD